MDRNEFAVPAQLDRVRISIEYRRDLPGNPVDVSMSGASQKKDGPLWTFRCRVDDPTNVESELASLLGGVTYYRPTAQDQFERIAAGEGTIWSQDRLPFD